MLAKLFGAKNFGLNSVGLFLPIYFFKFIDMIMIMIKPVQN